MNDHASTPEVAALMDKAPDTLVSEIAQFTEVIAIAEAGKQFRLTSRLIAVCKQKIIDRRWALFDSGYCCACGHELSRYNECDNPSHNDIDVETLEPIVFVPCGLPLTAGFEEGV